MSRYSPERYCWVPKPRDSVLVSLSAARWQGYSPMGDAAFPFGMGSFAALSLGGLVGGAMIDLGGLWVALLGLLIIVLSVAYTLVSLHTLIALARRPRLPSGGYYDRVGYGEVVKAWTILDKPLAERAAPIYREFYREAVALNIDRDLNGRKARLDELGAVILEFGEAQREIDVREDQEKANARLVKKGLTPLDDDHSLESARQYLRALKELDTQYPTDN